MKLLLCLLVLILSIIAQIACPRASFADAASDQAASSMPYATNSNNAFNLNDVYGSGATGDQSHTSEPVLGESHPYSGAGHLNNAGGLTISDYPNWSSQTDQQRYGASVTNTPHQQPVGQHGGLPPTTSRLISNMNEFAGNTIGGAPYLGVRNSAHGGIPQVGGTLPPTWLNNQVDLNIGGY
jgi:hypothetical protein